MENIKNLAKGTKIYSYDELSESAKENARKEVLEFENRNKLRDFVGKNIHYKINNGLIKKEVARSRVVKRWNEDKTRFELVIRENLMQFLKDGTYVCYFA